MTDPPIPRNKYQLMYQDVWWVTADLRKLRIADMDPRHRDNLIPFLVRNERLYNMQAAMSAAASFRGHDSDAADWAFDQMLDELERPDWLESTPLMRKLREYEAQRSELGKIRTRIHNKTYPIRRRLGLTD